MYQDSHEDILEIYWKLLLEREVWVVPGNQRRPNKLPLKSLSTYHQIHVILSQASKIISLELSGNLLQ